jgi:UDP:flavonoid glycosyltransferase YjiC (YdhE family)
VPNAAVAIGGDQPYYARRIHELGAGPRAAGSSTIKVRKLTVDRLAELITTLTTPDQASHWLAGAAAARSHLLQERGLEVAVERLSKLMTNGAPLAWSQSATD